MDCCTHDAACDKCLPRRFGELAGVAYSRGIRWAEHVADSTKKRDSWPDNERSSVIAKRKVRDLSRDPRLIELLAAECARSAARRWEEIRHGLPRFSEWRPMSRH